MRRNCLARLATLTGPLVLLLLLQLACPAPANASCPAVSAPASGASVYSSAACQWSGYDLEALASADLFGIDSLQRMVVFRLCGAVQEPSCASSTPSSQLCAWAAATNGSVQCSAPVALQTNNASYTWSRRADGDGLLITAYPYPATYCSSGAPLVSYVSLQCSNASEAVPTAGLSSVVVTNTTLSCDCAINITIHTTLVCGQSWGAPSSSTGASQPSSWSSSSAPSVQNSTVSPTAITAIQMTSSAAWPSRGQGGLYIVPASSTVQLTLNSTGGATSSSVAHPSTIVLYGGIEPHKHDAVQYNDVWASTDGGASFSSVVYTGDGYGSTYYGPSTCQDRRKQILYSLAGNHLTFGDNDGGTTVWSSTDLGQTWSSADGGFPGRTNAACVVDSGSRVFVMAGKQTSNTGEAVSNDVWMGTLKATSPAVILSWKLQTLSAPFRACDAPMAASYFSPQLGLDVLYQTGGYGYTSYQAHNQDDGVGTNEVWASVDSGVSWTLMTVAAFGPRYHASMLATADGVLVLLGGANAPPTYFSGTSNVGNDGSIQQGGEYDLNDFWVSLDGGYTWGECASQFFPLFDNIPAANASSFPAGNGRQDPLLQIDPNTGFLYMGSGWQHDQYGNLQKPNDLYRSSISFQDISAVAASCGLLSIPSGGTGLLHAPVSLLQSGVAKLYNHSDPSTCLLEPYGLSLAALASDLMWTSADGSWTWLVNLCRPVTSSYMCELLAPEASVCRYATCNPWGSRDTVSWAALSEVTPSPTWYPTNGVDTSAGVESRFSGGQACGNGSLQTVVRLVCNAAATVAFISSVSTLNCSAVVVIQSSVTCDLLIPPPCPSGCCGLGYDFSALGYDLYGYDDNAQTWGLHMCGALSTPQCDGFMLCEQAACHPGGYGTFEASTFDPYAMVWSFINGQNYSGGVQFAVSNGGQCNETGPAFHIAQFLCDSLALHPSTFVVHVDETGCTFTSVVHTALVCGPPSLNSSRALLAESVVSAVPAEECSFGGFDFSSLSTYDVYGAADDYLYVSRLCGAINDPQCALNSGVAQSSVCQINTQCYTVSPQSEVMLSAWNPHIAQWSLAEGGGGVSLVVQDGQQCSTGPSTVQWLLMCDEEAEWAAVTDVVHQSGDGCSFLLTVATQYACPSHYNATLAAINNSTVAAKSSHSSTGGLLGRPMDNGASSAERSWLGGTLLSASMMAAGVALWLLNS